MLDFSAALMPTSTYFILVFGLRFVLSAMIDTWIASFFFFESVLMPTSEQFASCMPAAT